MKYIRSFDGLRAVSIIFVLLNHIGILAFFPQRNFVLQRIWPLISGVTGVNIFFTLSGFLITSILLHERDRSGISLKRFYIRRFLRLLPPLIIFYTIVGVLLATKTIGGSWASFSMSFFYLYNFAPPAMYIPECIHTWSLAVEEQFYFSWPLLLTVYKARKTFVIGLIVVGLCMVGKLIIPAIPVTMGGKETTLGNYFRTDLWFIPAVAPIIIGAMMAIVVYSFQEGLKRIFGYHRQILAMSLLLFVCTLYLAPFILDFAYLFQAVGIALLLGVLMFNERILLSRVLSFGPLVYIGKISYGLYVFQGLFLRNGPGGKLWINHFPQDILLTFGIAILSYHIVERPILRYKKKFE